ncbi:glycosyltransferase [candidate division FCPU426 bacterium]|nr:glycosyltransferase [candidate division FCPU426 bacterium]
MQELVSVIIPVYNAQHTIAQCLESVRRSDYPVWEIICVDDASQDRSMALIKSAAAGDKRIRWIEGQHRGPACARNRGVEAAKGGILVFIDSDIMVNPDTISRLAACLQQEGIGGAGGRVLPSGAGTVYERFFDHWYEMHWGREDGYHPGLPTANFAMRKTRFHEIGGFDETFLYPAGEDYDLCYRLTRKGYRILFNSSATVYHVHPCTLKGLIRKAWLYGREEMKQRRKRGRSMLRETVIIFGILAVLPVRLPLQVHKLYRKPFRFLGFLFELVSAFGRFRGLAKHGWGRPVQAITREAS